MAAAKKCPEKDCERVIIGTNLKQVEYNLQVHKEMIHGKKGLVSTATQVEFGNKGVKAMKGKCKAKDLRRQTQ